MMIRENIGPDSLRTLFAINIFSMIGNSVMVVQPMVVGALVDVLEFSEKQAGFVASAELAGYACANLIMATQIHKRNRWLVGLIGLSIIISMNVASSFQTTFGPIIGLRFLSGTGAGICFSVFIATGAASKLPDRVFAIVNAISIAYSGLFIWIAPSIIAEWGLSGIFLIMAALAVCAMPLIFWIPKFVKRDGRKASTSTFVDLPRKQVRFSILLVFGMMLFLYVGHSGIWAYQERIGVAIGLAGDTIGNLLGTSMLIWGVVGSVLAGILGLRLGRILPQYISLGLSILAALLLVYGGSALTYGFASALIAFTWFYGLPYQMGLLAALDPQGRASVAGTIMTTGGASIGPALAALLIGGGAGYLSIGWMAGACYLFSLVLIISPATLLNQRDKLTTA